MHWEWLALRKTPTHVCLRSQVLLGGVNKWMGDHPKIHRTVPHYCRVCDLSEYKPDYGYSASLVSHRWPHQQTRSQDAHNELSKAFFFYRGLQTSSKY